MLGHCCSLVEHNGRMCLDGLRGVPPPCSPTERPAHVQGSPPLVRNAPLPVRMPAEMIVRRGADKAPPAFCELVPAVPSPPPCHLHRNSRRRSHPPHFALTASMPTHPPPQSIEVRRRVPSLRHSGSLCQKGKWSDEYLVKRISAFLWLDGAAFCSTNYLWAARIISHRQ
jgi:hypothetical protein